MQETEMETVHQIALRQTHAQMMLRSRLLLRHVAAELSTQTVMAMVPSIAWMRVPMIATKFSLEFVAATF
jgi:hypothetical protein